LVQSGFFKPEEKDETIAQEAKRYKQVENQLLHIQIEMDLPCTHRPVALSGFATATGAAGAYSGAVPISLKVASAEIDLGWGLKKKRRQKVMRCQSAVIVQQACMNEGPPPTRQILDEAKRVQAKDMDAVKRMQRIVASADASAASTMEVLQAQTEQMKRIQQEAASAEIEGNETACVEADLNLARVQLGSLIGTAAHDDVVPKYAKRAAGVAVRLTRMGYGVASDGEITAPRVHRFIKQMSFERRARALAHGSLVTEQGNWNETGDGVAPIALPPLPSSIEALAQLFVQFPTKDVHKFATGGADAAIKLEAGGEMHVPEAGLTLKNIGGTIVATRVPTPQDGA